MNDATTPTVLSGGNWSAVLSNNVTYYVSGNVSASGKVILQSIGTLTVSSGAVVSGATISGSTYPTVSVLNGGVVQNSLIWDGYVSAFNGAELSNNVLNSNWVVLNSGASSINDTYINSGNVQPGAGITVASGASFVSATLGDASAGSFVANVLSGATAANINTYGGSVLSLATPYGSGKQAEAPSRDGATVLSGGNWSAVLSNNVTYYVSGNVSVSGKVILQSIGTLTVSSGAVVSGATISGSTYPTVSVLNGGVVQNSLIWDGYVSAFNGAKLSNNVLNSNWVVLNSGASSINDTYINSGNVQPGAGITVANGASLVSPYIGDASAGSFVAVVSSGATVSDPTVAPNGGQLVISSGKLASNEPAPCFLAGTLIEMEGSAKPVEDIRIGDHVMTYQNDVCEQREVIWAGRRKITIDASKPDDLADYPVRVVRNALGEGRPFKDLLITAEHCLFLDGAFVPVRMLVNGQSIYYDTKITQYECFHIETEKHAILMSDGILSESYLDTGGRQRFRQTGKILALGGRTLSWQDSAAAPLVTTRDFVEPLYERFTQRAEMLAIGLKRQQSPIVTYNPELYIVTDAGQRLAPLRNKSEQYLFALPLDTREVRIVSNRSRPCDAVGPYVDDRRMLGVLISGIEIYDSRGKLNLSEILTSQDVDGWHSIETYGRRWTDGNARLILPRLRSNNATLLAIQVDAAGPYVSRMEEVNQWSHVAGSKNF